MGKPIFSPDLTVQHERRPDVYSYARQVFQSGQGRMQITLLEPASMHPFVLAPLLWLGYLTVVVVSGRRGWMDLPVAAYAFASVWEGLRCWRSQKSLKASLYLPGLIFLGHAAYAVGMICGALFRVPQSSGCEANIPHPASRQACPN